MCPDSPPDIPAVEVVRAGSSAGGTHVATLRIGSVAGGSGGEVTLDVLLDRGLVDVRIDAADGETARWIAGRSERLVEAIEATGASAGQVLNYGIVPQVMPAFWGISVFRWDINIRESTILGLVGAGGIGLKLQASLNVLAWPQVTVILLLILGTVVFSEWVSAKVRRAII